MYKNLIKYILIFIVCQTITYYVAGMFARFVLGASQFYPPSLQAIRYLRDPNDPAVQGWVLPAQILRGFLFALVLFPFRSRLAELGPWLGGLAVMSLILVMGYIAASGGMIEHFLFFRVEDYPPYICTDYFYRNPDAGLIIGNDGHVARPTLY